MFQPNSDVVRRLESLGLEIVAGGVKYFGDSEMDGGVAWRLLRIVDADKLRRRQVDKYRSRQTAVLNAMGIGARYNGPGKFFAHGPTAWFSRRRVLVRQWFGYDI